LLKYFCEEQGGEGRLVEAGGGFDGCCRLLAVVVNVAFPVGGWQLQIAGWCRFWSRWDRRGPDATRKGGYWGGLGEGVFSKGCTGRKRVGRGSGQNNQLFVSCHWHH